MKVSDIKADSTVDEIVLKIIEKGEPREVQRRFGGANRVCDAVGEDGEGNKVKIVLWNEEIDLVETNEKLKISNGWAKEWNKEIQVSRGRFGKLGKVE
jgi:ssDNA-binding replication factor A large subunit